MILKETFVYHMKLEFYSKFNDPYLTNPKTTRPFYCCIQDTKIPKIYWMIPMSTRIQKAQEMINKISNGVMCHCHLVEIATNIGSKPSAFMILDAFPVIEKYVDKNYKIGQHPFVILDHSLVLELKRKLKKVINIKKSRGRLNSKSIDIFKIYNKLKIELDM